MDFILGLVETGCLQGLSLGMYEGGYEGGSSESSVQQACCEKSF